jgi:hypothetical protein
MNQRDHLNAQRLAAVYGVANDQAGAIQRSTTERDALVAKLSAAVAHVVADSRRVTNRPRYADAATQRSLPA